MNENRRTNYHQPRSNRWNGYNRGSRNAEPNNQKLKSFSGQFTEIDLDAKLLGEEQIEGVCLVKDFEKTRSLQIRLGKLVKGPTDFFPVMWPISLSTENLHRLKSESYVVSVKPTGQRILLYIDSLGDIYLENNSQHIFRVDDACTLKLVSSMGRPLTDTILDGLMNFSSSDGKFTFFIQDAMRFDGIDITNLGILERFTFVKEEIMKPRIEELEKKKLFENNEAFNLDMVEIREPFLAEEFLDDELEKNFRYPVHSLVFFPRHQVSKFGTNYDLFQWKYNDILEGVFRLKIPKESQEEIDKAELHAIGYYRTEVFYTQIAMTDEIRQHDGQIIACEYINHQWVFKKVRKERQHPNSIKTIEGKFLSMENPVSRNDLLMYFENSRGRD